jgi:thiol-disulfide isomerase/thioredoxin
MRRTSCARLRAGALLGLVAALALALAGCGAGPAGSDVPTVVGGGDTGPAGRPPEGDHTGTADAPADVPASALPPCEAASAASPGPAVPGGLPELTLPCVGTGPDVRLAELRGPLVLNVWAPWCEPCADEMPVLAAVAERAGDRVDFLGVSIAAGMDQTRAGAVELGLAFPSVLDHDTAIRTHGMNVVGPPYTYLVDAAGRVAHVQPGEIRSEEQLVGLIEEHLGVRL